MYEKLTEYIQRAAYLQWEETGSGSALDHWRCVEDIACFIETRGILTEDALAQILRNSGGAISYEELVREIAYRLSFFTESKTAEENWYLTERLLHNAEWRRMTARAAHIYADRKGEPGFIDNIRSGRVREFYRKK